jgi:NADH-quinone oxidoreductase subunit J
MLLNLGEGEAVADFRGKWGRIAAGGAGLALLAQLLVLTRGAAAASPVAPAEALAENVVAPVAAVLFTEHLLAFEVTSILLLVAVVGAVVLAKRGARG